MLLIFKKGLRYVQIQQMTNSLRVGLYFSFITKTVISIEWYNLTCFIPIFSLNLLLEIQTSPSPTIIKAFPSKLFILR